MHVIPVHRTVDGVFSCPNYYRWRIRNGPNCTEGLFPAKYLIEYSVLRTCIRVRGVAAIKTTKLKLLAVLPVWLLATAAIDAAVFSVGFESGDVTGWNLDHSFLDGGFHVGGETSYIGNDRINSDRAGWMQYSTTHIASESFGAILFPGRGGLASGQQRLNQGRVDWIPEPSTFISGALLAIPFGLHGVRILRKRKKLV